MLQRICTYQVDANFHSAISSKIVFRLDDDEQEEQKSSENALFGKHPKYFLRIEFL